MLRPVLIVAFSVLLVAVSPARQSAVPSPAEMKAMEAQAAAAQKRDALAAGQINALAGNIHSLKDSQRLIGLVEKQFSHSFKRREIPGAMRRRIVLAEYESVTSPSGPIPDERIADAWNWYMSQIGAPQQTRVTAKMVYAERDASYTIARMNWPRYQQIWTMPGIFALDTAGKVNRHGATALEALSVVHSFAMDPANIEGARQMARRGILFSDVIAREEKNPKSVKERSYVAFNVRPRDYNKVDAAARRYIREHGAGEFERVLEGFVYRLFPAQPAG